VEMAQVQGDSTPYGYSLIVRSHGVSFSLGSVDGEAFG
jgi:hypothetical protein